MKLLWLSNSLQPDNFEVIKTLSVYPRNHHIDKFVMTFSHSICVCVCACVCACVYVCVCVCVFV